MLNKSQFLASLTSSPYKRHVYLNPYYLIHVSFNKNKFKSMQKLKNICIYSEETKQSSEPDLDMTQVLELANRELEIAMINMLRALMEKVGNMK